MPASNVQQTHPIPRRYLELTQDVIVILLCAALFVAMSIKLVHLARLMMAETNFGFVMADILFILVLLELFRILVIYLERHRVSVATMVEVGIVTTLREVIVKGVLDIEWPMLLVLSAFILSLGFVLRHSGIRTRAHPPQTSDRAHVASS